MAQLLVTGIEVTIKDLQKMGDQAEEVARQMLHAAGEIVTWEWQKAIKAKGHIDTGDMMMSVKADKSAKKTGDGLAITVYPRGSDETGTNNALKAFVLHFGRKNMSGSGFVDIANKNAQEPAWSAMEDVFDRFIAQRS